MTDEWGKTKEIDERMVWAFRNTFLRDDETLGVLLTLGEMMHFFNDDQDSVEQQILSNFFKKMLVYCGMWWQPNSTKMMKSLADVGPPNFEELEVKDGL